jgi:hypothetical protein
VAFTERATVYVADSPRDVEAAKIGGAVATGDSPANHTTLTCSRPNPVSKDNGSLGTQ